MLTFTIRRLVLAVPTLLFISLVIFDGIVVVAEPIPDAAMARRMARGLVPGVSIAVIRDGEIVGYLSSGAYGHSLGGAMGLGYVPCKGESAADVLASTYEIDVMGTRVVAEASLKPMYDAKSERVKV